MSDKTAAKSLQRFRIDQGLALQTRQKALSHQGSLTARNDVAGAVSQRRAGGSSAMGQRPCRRARRAFLGGGQCCVRCGGQQGAVLETVSVSVAGPAGGSVEVNVAEYGRVLPLQAIEDVIATVLPCTLRVRLKYVSCSDSSDPTCPGTG